MYVQVNARNRAYRFEAAAGEKILYAGLRSQIGLPYECGTGTCGTCRAKLIEGKSDAIDIVFSNPQINIPIDPATMRP